MWRAELPRYHRLAQEEGEAVTGSLRVLLAGAIDYAGLFPPASLDMTAATANYQAYREGPDAWALGRFVVPVGRLSEFAEVSARQWPLGETAAPWRVSAILTGGDLATEVEQIADFNTRYGRSGGIVPDGQRGGAWIDTAELRCATTGEVARAADALPRWLDTYIEIAAAGDPEAALHAIRDARLKAKVRTGGITADAFPSARQLARFIALCAACKIPFKATAGLHHPVRAEHPLTYEPGSACGTMFGFVNVLAAAVLAREGHDESTVAQALDERDASAFALGDSGLRWRDAAVSLDVLRAAHDDLLLAFGSCSFTEPLGEARALGLL